MKQKILEALKTKYSKFGFSQKVLDGVASALEKTITDESKIEEHIDGLEPLFAVFQSDGDRSRTENIALKSQVDELNKKLEAAGKKAGEDPAEGEPEWFKAYKVQQEQLIAQLKSESQQLKVEKAKNDRANLITRIAKELSIPEWRVKEGFVISEDADESVIRETLTSVQQNIVTAGLSGKGGNPLAGKEVTKEEASKIAEGMI